MQSRGTQKKQSVSISRLGQRYQVAIPKAICERLGLRKGDFVELTIRNGGALLKPRAVQLDDTLTPEEEKCVRKGERQLKQGKYILWDDLKKKLKL